MKCWVYYTHAAKKTLKSILLEIKLLQNSNISGPQVLQAGLLVPFYELLLAFAISYTTYFFVLQIVKTAVRELWSLEYEIEEIQTEFAKGIGSIDIANLTDDFVEDVMLQSKPLQGILMAIRLRQKVCIVLLTTIYALSLSNWNDCAP